MTTTPPRQSPMISKKTPTFNEAKTPPFSNLPALSEELPASPSPAQTPTTPTKRFRRFLVGLSPFKRHRKAVNIASTGKAPEWAAVPMQAHRGSEPHDYSVHHEEEATIR